MILITPCKHRVENQIFESVDGGKITTCYQTTTINNFKHCCKDVKDALFVCELLLQSTMVW